MTFKKYFRNQKYVNEIESINHEFKANYHNEAGKVKTSEITIYGDIGDYWWGSTSAKDVKEVLDKSKGADIIVSLNSGGGDAFEGIAIYNLLKNHDGNVTINIDGYAASAASIIAMAADTLNMNLGTMIMIHEAWTFAYGSKRDLKSVINALEGIDTSLADIYMTRFKGERSEIETFIENETWFTTDEAVLCGLADNKVEVAKEEPKEDDPEDFKNNVLARFNAKQVDESIEALQKTGILAKFKRQN